ncbi:hypothetical protein PRZ48_014325 [Zasmidium cellare]|uniref:Acyl-coenzyme A oxidase n=1 Tax=Zasmidium cellare TaxID=395010 RepID=A0ABR0DY38_ZASCE|nr:hypothetical protein PRZ48_014360 [Zasmidium cellare]KAK4494969.1 hypothetical protein PRZ48_014325 [Zasmidium cellare]
MSQPDFSANLKPHPQANGAATLAKERQQSSFDTNAISKHLFGDAYLERQARILKIVTAEKVFSKTNQANLSRPDRYKLGLARGKRLRQLMNEHNWNDDDFLMAEWLVDDVLPHHLNISLFKSAILEQCNEEQRAYWYPKLQAWEIIGAYAQTELGHGSNVRGLEATATWDHQTKEFVLHSPTLTASKWWNGTLGRTATHCVFVAQLRIPKRAGSEEFHSYGPHPFIMRVRDERTHKPMEGIIVGDIGPKYGYAPMDNAYMLLNQYRVPHDALLSRYATVNRETGEYVKPKNTGAMYGQLTRGRSQIVMNARLVLARAVTVAVRYLSIRRQFRDQDASDQFALEEQVLNYSTVQIRVLPLLASAFALHYSGAAMQELYERTRGADAQKESALNGLQELHFTSAGLKSLTTEMAADGIETCRRAMGGHGFGGGTGLIQLNNDYLSKPTVEGDNWMITQQVARYLLKKVKDLSTASRSTTASRLDASLARFREHSKSPPQLSGLSDARSILEAFEWRTAFLAFEAYESREVKKLPWNSLLVEFRNLSRAHTQAMLVVYFYEGLRGLDALPSSTKAVLWDLFRLFSLSTIEKDAWQFQRSGAVATKTLDQLPKEVLALMQRIRPHAVRVVDSFALPDYLLNSDLGRSDGKVYESLFHRAHVENPLNRITFNPRYWEDELVMGSKDGGQILSKL